MKQTPETGFTLLEILISLGILAVALLGLMSAIMASSNAQEAAREQALAVNAARSILDQMRASGDFVEIFRRYNTSSSDDAGLTGPVPGAAFDVDGLVPVGTDSDQRVGRIVLPQDEFTPEILQEDSDFTVFGVTGGMDLNGNGSVADAIDPGLGEEYTLLPVRIIVEWNGIKGFTSTEIHTILYPMNPPEGP